MSFRDYKTSRKDGAEKLRAQAQAIANTVKKFEKDPDDWFPETDKAGNCICVIRLLPRLEGEEIDFAHLWSHNFKNETTGRWYIKNSRTSYGFEDTEKSRDPCMEYNNLLWKAAGGKDAVKNNPLKIQYDAQKRKENFRCNVFVISDSHHPENNGSIKKYRHTKGVFNKYLEALSPPVVENAEPEPSFNPFDLYEGAALKIKVTTDKTKKDERGNPVRNYEYTWLSPGPLGDDAMIEKIYNELNGDPKWSLEQYISDDKFESYEELHKKLVFVMGFDPLEEDAPKTEKPQEISQKETKSSEPKSGKVLEN